MMTGKKDELKEDDDLVQEIFSQAFNEIKSFRGKSLFMTWLHRLAINHVLMYFRKLKRENEVMVIELDAEHAMSAIFIDPRNSGGRLGLEIPNSDGNKGHF